MYPQNYFVVESASVISTEVAIEFYMIYPVCYYSSSLELSTHLPLAIYNSFPYLNISTNITTTFPNIIVLFLSYH